MNTAVDGGDLTRIRELALSLDCLAEEDLCALARILPTTAEAWRKRGKGPAYVLFGNNFLYPRKGVADFLQSSVRERRFVPAKAIL